jgi:hypothetical protein
MEGAGLVLSLKVSGESVVRRQYNIGGIYIRLQRFAVIPMKFQGPHAAVQVPGCQHAK